MADITITEISLENTLLLDAINKGKARFVSDCASYLQVRHCSSCVALVVICRLRELYIDYQRLVGKL
jgi:hypothetical protein